MRQCNHDVITVVRQHRCLPPITLTYTMAAAGAMFADAHGIVQRSSIKLQGTNHASAESNSRWPVAVVSGNAGCVGDVLCGSEAGR